MLCVWEGAWAACNYPSDLDSAGNRCGGRAASVIPGGRLGGDGRYQDSQGRNRVYGRGNDQYDSPQGGYNQPSLFGNNSNQQNSDTPSLFGR